jgi:anti-anti-sigma factor
VTGSVDDGVIRVEHRGPVTVLRLCGEVDADAVEGFSDRCCGVVPAVDVIDSREVTFIGASGVSLLLAVQERSRALGYAGHLVRPAACVQRLIALLGLHLGHSPVPGPRAPVDGVVPS